MKINEIIEGDTLDQLKKFPDESIDCVITSPPYWALRDYGVDGQLGLEPTFQEYIIHLCDIFDEVKRVLKKEGTCWVNLGDTYNRNKKGKTDNKISDYLKNTTTNLHKKRGNLPDKSLCQIPSRFAIEMSNRGWILRNEIIWHKPNCMPSSVKDRFTVDFEKVFFFVKNKKYWFEKQYEPLVVKSDMEYRKTLRIGRHYNVKEPYKNNIPYHKNMKENIKGQTNHTMHINRINRNPKSWDNILNYNPNGKNKRCIWSINTKPFKEAHFATFPETLIEPIIKGGCPENGLVLDIFMGAGTTAIVAKKLNRNYIGIELNSEYIKIAKKRINGY